MTMKKLLLSFLPALIALVLVVSPLASLAQTTDEDFQNAVRQLRESRQGFKDARAQERNEASQESKAKGQAQREAVQQRRAAAQGKMEEKRKETLLRLVDIQIKHLGRTKERVERMPNITDALKIQLAIEIDSNIQKVNDQKAKVESASGREAIKALAKEIRDLFKSYRVTVKSIVDAIHASRANVATAKAEERAAAIKAKVQELKQQGKDTTEIEVELEDAEGDIDDAEDAIGRKAFKEANEDLKGAYQKFRSIAEKAKRL